MGKCQNCGTALGCSCQVRKLPNGKVGCTKCINQQPNQLPNSITKENPKKNG